MPANKEALVRYRAINRCLIDRKVATKDNLIDACTEAVGAEVSWRTIAGDIKAMRQDKQLGYFAPIKNIKGEGYSYEEKGYSIDQLPLKQDELTAISFAANLLRQYSQVPLFSTFSGAVEKISEKVNLSLREQNIAELGNLMSFEHSGVDGGSNHIESLLQHIRQETVVNITYHSFSSNRISSHIIHPYFLKQYRNRWYVIGYHETYGGLRTLALERIQELEPDYSITYRPSDFDAETYYRNAIGVSITEEKPQEVVFEIPPREYQYIERQPLHSSQKVVDRNDDWVRVSLYVILNYELKSTLLALGSGVNVLKPESLKSHLLDEAQGIVNHYLKE